MRISVWLVLVAVLFAGVIVAGNSITGLRGVYGPYKCVGSCALTTPSPDQATLAFIKVMDQAFVNQPGHHHFQQQKGDTIRICNDKVCVDYTRVPGNEWKGGNPYPVPAGSGAGGSGSFGGRGGVSLGGAGVGCIAGCNGTVSVGPVDNVKER